MTMLRLIAAWFARRWRPAPGHCHACGVPVAPDETECAQCWQDRQV